MIARKNAIRVGVIAIFAVLIIAELRQPLGEATYGHCTEYSRADATITNSCDFDLTFGYCGSHLNPDGSCFDLGLFPPGVSPAPEIPQEQRAVHAICKPPARPYVVYNQSNDRVPTCHVP